VPLIFPSVLFPALRSPIPFMLRYLGFAPSVEAGNNGRQIPS
jgi:hypothetical protein